VLTYGQTRQEAIDRAQALSLRVLADRLDHGEPIPQMSGVFAFHDNDELGPRMLSRIAKHTGLTPDDL
jgi:predicted RNase H-like HicB family nuclease